MKFAIFLAIVWLLSLCGCATTVSRSPSPIENGEIAVGAYYGTVHSLTGPKLIGADGGVEPTRTLIPYVSLGLTDDDEFSGAGFFAGSSGGLYTQLKHRLSDIERVESALIFDAFGFFSTTKGPDEGVTRSYFEKDSESVFGISVAPSIGFRVGDKISVFAGPEVAWLRLVSKYSRSTADSIDKIFSGLLYGGFIGCSAELFAIGHGHVSGEITLRGQSAPRDILEHAREFYFDAFVSLKFVVASFSND